MKDGEAIRKFLVDRDLDQLTFQCMKDGWPNRVRDYSGEQATILIAWATMCLSKLETKPWSAELAVRRETKNFPIEGHRHPNTKSSVFLKTWLGAPTILEDGSAALGETLFLKDEWHAAPDTNEPRLVTLLYCKFEKDQFEVRGAEMTARFRNGTTEK